MKTCKTANLAESRNWEKRDEIIGILKAISIVSKRLAKYLALLEQRTAEQKEGTR